MKKYCDVCESKTQVYDAAPWESYIIKKYVCLVCNTPIPYEWTEDEEKKRITLCKSINCVVERHRTNGVVVEAYYP